MSQSKEPRTDSLTGRARRDDLRLPRGIESTPSHPVPVSSIMPPSESMTGKPGRSLATRGKDDEEAESGPPRVVQILTRAPAEFRPPQMNAASDISGSRPPTNGHETPSSQHAACEARIQMLSDELRDAEAECEALWTENRRLEGDRSNFQAVAATCDQIRHQLERTQHELEHSRQLIAAMEHTRGWRMLLQFRRVRNRLLGRP